MPFIDGTFANLMKGAAEDSAKEFAVAFNTISEGAQQAFNFIDGLSGRNFENQLSRLEQQKEIELTFAGDSTAAREEIERQYEEKRREIQIKQAKAEKKQAIFNSIINTAQAVISTWAQVPKVDFGVSAGALAAIVAGIGAAQTALIAAQPLPEFKHGVKNFEGGAAILGDGGVHEYVTLGNKFLGVSDKKDTIYNLPKGATVHKDYNTFMNNINNELLTQGINPIVSNPIILKESGITEQQFLNGINKLNTTINNKQGVNVVIDKKGFYTGVSNGSKSIIKKNNQLRLKGSNV